jgi:glycosyltransferase involved in cell wall biosynthesis
VTPTAGGKPWIVVPAFQAERALGAVLGRIPRGILDGCTILVVDDGSSDATADIARAAGARVLVNPRNLGYARTQKRAFRAALSSGATAVVVLHADGQYPPESVPDVVRPILEGSADVVLGSRVLDGMAMQRGMPAYKWIANRALTWVENKCYGLSLSEYHTGMMAYSRGALLRLPFEAISDTFHFDGEMAMLSARRGLRVSEVSVPHVYAGERSYLRPIPYGFTVLAIAAGVRTGLYDRWLARRGGA